MRAQTLIQLLILTFTLRHIFFETLLVLHAHNQFSSGNSESCYGDINYDHICCSESICNLHAIMQGIITALVLPLKMYLIQFTVDVKPKQHEYRTNIKTLHSLLCV